MVQYLCRDGRCILEEIESLEKYVKLFIVNKNHFLGVLPILHGNFGGVLEHDVYFQYRKCRSIYRHRPCGTSSCICPASSVGRARDP